MNRRSGYVALAVGIAISFFAQQPPWASPRPVGLRAQSASTVSLSAKGDEQTLEITNVAFEVTSDSVPGRPAGERLLLRKTTSSTQVLGDKGVQATATFEAWPLGVDLHQKPIYTVKISGAGGETVDGALIVVDRRLEEVAWWSVYRLGNGQHLFDTYVPLVGFSLSSATVESRYIGLDVPPDDVANGVAVVTYASEDCVKRQVLLTCNDPGLAAELRSLADTTRKVSVTDELPPRAVRIAFAELCVTIPIAHDDLDIAHARLPAHLHLAAR